MSKFDGLYDIRDAEKGDRNFILKSFLMGLYYGDSWFSRIPKRIFMDNYKVVAAALFDSNKTNVKIACLREDPGVILGYSILSSDFTTIHWVYVKANWRKHGIATRLVPKHPVYVSHLTQLGFDLLTKFPQQVSFNPFSI